MTNSDSPSEQQQRPSPKTSKEVKTPTANNPVKNTQHWSQTLLALVGLLLLFCAIYATLTCLSLRRDMLQQNNALQKKMNALQQQLSANTTTNDTSAHAITQIKDELDRKITSIDSAFQDSVKQRNYQANDWLLLKARYCLELAQINQHWSNNTVTSIALLQQADTLLATIHEQRLFVIRQAIAKEIALLQAIPQLDITGILSQLDALQTLITNTDITPKTRHYGSIDSSKVNQTVPPLSWKDHLKNTLSFLEKLVVVQRRDRDVIPLPTVAYETIQRELIVISLQEAQWAVLHNNVTVYQFSLNQALNNAKKLFDNNQANVKAIFTPLSQLVQIQLKQQSPKLDTALTLLNQVIESNQANTHEKTAQPSGEKS